MQYAKFPDYLTNWEGAVIIMLNKEADTIEEAYPFPAKENTKK